MTSLFSHLQDAARQVLGDGTSETWLLLVSQPQIPRLLSHHQLSRVRGGGDARYGRHGQISAPFDRRISAGCPSVSWIGNQCKGKKMPRALK
jgi:hypothetical protein